jgi:hypothetical protein
MSLVCQPVVPYGVDAVVDAVQAGALDAGLDRAPPQAQNEQLSRRHDTMLPIG